MILSQKKNFEQKVIVYFLQKIIDAKKNNETYNAEHFTILYIMSLTISQ